MGGTLEEERTQSGIGDEAILQEDKRRVLLTGSFGAGTHDRKIREF